ncbi:hypothetical protein [Marinomonas primoryensis]|uniref:Uncharacterized protein n=1 Tax=Marinomonas primoryensis TaxID=178399 RepID=A0ABV0KXP8_9GAMM
MDQLPFISGGKVSLRVRMPSATSLGCPYLANKCIECNAGALALAFDEVVLAGLLGGGWVVVALAEFLVRCGADLYGVFFPCVVVCPAGFDAGDGAAAGSVELAVDELA